MAGLTKSVDHHGVPVVLFDGSNGDAVAEYIQRPMDLCPDRSCVGCPMNCAALKASTEEG